MNPRGETRWTRATLGRPDRSLDLLTARFDHHRYAPHTHEEFSIGICVQGASCIDYRGGALTVGEGSIVVLAPGEVHTGESAFGTYAYRALYPAPPSSPTASSAAPRTSASPSCTTPNSPPPCASRTPS